MKASIFGVCTVLALGACTIDDDGIDVSSIDQELQPGPPNQHISDAVHLPGTPGFFLLPPFVPQPATTGTFNATFRPRLTITFTQTDCVDQGTLAGSPTFTITKVNAYPLQSMYHNVQ